MKANLAPFYVQPRPCLVDLRVAWSTARINVLTPSCQDPVFILAPCCCTLTKGCDAIRGLRPGTVIVRSSSSSVQDKRLHPP